MSENKRYYGPSTELQRLAQVENYALFQLASMKSNLHHLRELPELYKDPLLLKTILELKSGIQSIDLLIRCTQGDRKRARKKLAKEKVK